MGKRGFNYISFEWSRGLVLYEIAQSMLSSQPTRQPSVAMLQMRFMHDQKGGRHDFFLIDWV
jgi:hypothetical protein